MTFLPYTRGDASRQQSSVGQPMTRRVQAISTPEPISITRRVQESFVLRQHNFAAFKIVPQERLPAFMQETLADSHEWGAQVMFTGGIIGSVVVEDLAKRTRPDGILSTSWDFPSLEEGETWELHSVMVRSAGDAERFPPDMLMALHAPDLAEQTRGAHVFHFFNADESMLFQNLLGSRILEVLN